MKQNKELLLETLHKARDPKKAEFFPKFFKTGPGQYGEGDQFLGITVPKQRAIAKTFVNKVSLDDLQALIRSPLHEVRFTSLLILILKYKTKTIKEDEKKEIVTFYLKNTKYINNWDLVDVSADKILGEYYFNKPKEIIYDLQNSHDLWENRIAILSSFYWIRKGQFDDTISLCKYFLNHPHDLIHKASGWMLREVGKRDTRVLKSFLSSYANVMPRTMLRYAIEKLPPSERKKWLEKK